MRQHRSFAGIMVGLLFLSASRVQAGEIEDLKLRVDELEKVQAASLLKQPFQTFSAQRLHIGGFQSLQFESRYGGDTKPENTFGRGDLGLMIAADLADRLKLFSFVRFGFVSTDEDSNAPWREKEDYFFESELEDFFTEYRVSDALVLQAGRIITPFGIINSERFDPLLLTHDRPQALRDLTETDFFLFDPDVLGVKTSGAGGAGAQKLGYDAYMGAVRTDPRSLAGGGRFFWMMPQGVTLGVSEQTGRRVRQTYRALGTDLKIERGAFTLRSELARSFIQNGEDQKNFYIEPSYTFANRRWIAFVLVDYLDDPLGDRLVDDDQNEATPPVRDPIKKYEWTAGLNYLPWPYVRLRLEETRHDYRGATATLGGETRDYFSTVLSMTVSF